jgi:hypothetical protein
VAVERGVGVGRAAGVPHAHGAGGDAVQPGQAWQVDRAVVVPDLVVVIQPGRASVGGWVGGRSGGRAVTWCSSKASGTRSFLLYKQAAPHVHVHVHMCTHASTRHTHAPLLDDADRAPHVRLLLRVQPLHCLGARPGQLIRALRTHARTGRAHVCTCTYARTGRTRVCAGRAAQYRTPSPTARQGPRVQPRTAVPGLASSTF